MDLSRVLAEPEMTELVDAKFDRVDLVQQGANGIPRFLIAKSATGRGLIPPDEVRALIGKQADDPAPAPAAEQHLTITGSVAAVAGLGQALAQGLTDHAAITKHIAAAAARARDTAPQEVPVPDPVTKADIDGPSAAEDAMDLSVVLAEPAGDADGSPTDPGSPAWESIDAATARMWTSIAVRLKNALGVMAEREWLEAASADPGDACAAMNLEDAMCAVDFAIGELAMFAVDEQAEADMAMVGKSAATETDGAAVAAITKALSDGKLPVALSVIETFDAVVAKAGRVLSSVNETHIREAAGRLNTVLAALPQAPVTDDSGQPVAKQEGAAMADPQDTDTATADPGEDVAKAADPAVQARNTGPVRQGGTTGLGLPRGTGPADALPADGPQEPQPGDVAGRTVIKADDGGKPEACAVYDAKGNLVGICKPEDITPIAGAQASPAADDVQMDDTAAAAPAADMTPAAPAAVGTPAAAVAPMGDDDVAKAAAQPGGDLITVTRDVLASVVAEVVKAALDAQAPAQDVAKGDAAAVLEKVDALEGRLAVVEKHPAAPGAFLNGQIPPEGAVPPPRGLRGQDQAPGGSAPAVDVRKALQRKADLYAAPDAESQNAMAQDMQRDAIAAFSALHRAGPQR